MVQIDVVSCLKVYAPQIIKWQNSSIRFTVSIRCEWQFLKTSMDHPRKNMIICVRGGVEIRDDRALIIRRLDPSSTLY